MTRLQELIEQLNPARREPATTVEKIAEHISVVNAQIAQADAECAVAADRLAAEAEGAADEVEAVVLARDRLVRRHTALQRALERAQERDRQAAEAATHAADAAQWREAEVKAREFTEHNARLARAIALTARHYRAALVSRERLADAIPVKRDEFAQFLSRSTWEPKLRAELHRAGVPGFEAEFPWNKNGYGMRTLEDEAADVLALIRRWAEGEDSNE
jgi:hypothetical protein